MNKQTRVFGVLGVALALLMGGCETTKEVVVIDENPAVYQILTAARTAAFSAGSLSAAIDTALSAHATAVRERNDSLLTGNFSLTSRAESVAATNIRAVGVTINETAISADALAGAGADIPTQYEITLLPQLRAVSQFSNTIARRSSELTAQVAIFSAATRNVREKAANVEVAVREVDSAVDVLAVADGISVARNELDDALAEVVRADVRLTQMLKSIQHDANSLQNAARIIEQTLPASVVSPRGIQ